jgi:hypothetical protein
MIVKLANFDRKLNRKSLYLRPIAPRATSPEPGQATGRESGRRSALALAGFNAAAQRSRVSDIVTSVDTMISVIWSLQGCKIERPLMFPWEADVNSRIIQPEAPLERNR